MCDKRSSSKRKSQIPARNFRIFECSTAHLCVYAMILYCTTCGGCCEGSRLPENRTEPLGGAVDATDSINFVPPENVTVTGSGMPSKNATDVINISTTTMATTPVITLPMKPNKTLHCDESGCYLKISSSNKALKTMLDVSTYLYEYYSEITGPMTGSSLEVLMKELKKRKAAPEPHDHDHEDHGHDHEDHGHEDHDHGDGHHHEHSDSSWSLDDILAMDGTDFLDALGTDFEEKDFPCYNSTELLEAYFGSSEDRQLSYDDFLIVMPQIVIDLSRPKCAEDEQQEAKATTTTEKSPQEKSPNVWLISFGSVAVISLVSLFGVLTIPVLRYSKMLNHALAYLVALAVGTLSGDALLHLLPQATGAHSHDHDHSHDHGAEEDHFDFLWKGLVACTGIYFFYLLETIMGFIRRRRERKRQSHQHQNGQVHDCDAELTKVVSVSASSSTSPNGCGSPLLKTDQKCHQPENGVTPLVQEDDFCVLKEHDGKPDNRRISLKIDNGLIATGHTHHHHSGEVPKTIANLAWMVIIGDGLHNMTDGLAIGAAFSSSIGAGLGTVLAIFFHEIPQELADFAVLLNAGMTVKQALFWNFLSACTCFLGLIIGLLVGEYTHGMILWILAFTAGGFLYIALVDMLPALINQLTNEGWKLRFFIQNAGLLSGFWVMVLIALKEESLSDYFK